MARFEDDDIKIFTPAAKNNADVDQDVIATMEALDRERQNGNVNKARVIGKHLSKLFIDEVNRLDSLPEEFQGSKVRQNTGVLFLFSAETALNMFLPTNTLATIAISALNDRLEDRKSDLFRNVYESPAYSFYYLNIRKGSEDIPNDIGSAYAMLCSHENDPAFIEMGSSLYNMVLDEVESDVKKAKFQI